MLKPRSALLLPPPELSSCFFAAILRDTRGTELSDADRFNHFPASPLVSVSTVIEGELYLWKGDAKVDDRKSATLITTPYIAPPQDRPVTSWSPGPVAVVTVGIFPEAWMKMESAQSAKHVPKALRDAFEPLQKNGDFERCWHRFCEEIKPVWQGVRSTPRLADWAGSQRVADWSRSIMMRAALAGPGRSARAFERRLRRWSRQSRQSLKFFADIDNLHARAAAQSQGSLAALAIEAGYTDQSHMGRAVRRATGFSPAQLNRFIETKEAFWCYRLLGQRF